MPSPLDTIPGIDLDGRSIVYLDNAATVYPKPDEVLERMLDLFRRFGVNPGRSGYDLCLVGGDIVETTRETLASFFGADHPERLCFAYNASDALNILVMGIVRPGDHVVSTTLEHNSVIRPLGYLAEQADVEVDWVPMGTDGRIDPDDVARLLRPDTRAVVMNHGSNVIGTIQPAREVGALCRERGVRLVLDVAQTAGIVPIDVEALGVDALAFTGHKSLLGPTGIGGLWVRDGVDVRITRFGGTGVRSAEPLHLDEYPWRLEVGTPNVMGIVGLLVAQEYIAGRGMRAIYEHEMHLLALLQTAIADVAGVTIHGTTSLENRLPVLSFTVEGRDPADVGTLLDGDHDIACRTGLHCAPLVHEQMGTAPRGTVRFSLGPSNTIDDVEAAIVAVRDVARASPRRGD